MATASSGPVTLSATLPGAPFLARQGDDLCLDGVSLRSLAQQHGTPLYVYSQAAILSALSGYQRALAGRDHLICYAMKANPTRAILQTLAQAGCGFDIVSGGELARVLAAGGDASRVVFSGVGKSRAEMHQALDAGVKCFNVESEPELLALSEVAHSRGQTARISLRVNPDVDAGTHPYISTGLRNNKFGVAHDRAVAVYEQAARLPGIEVTGIDCHIGSQITQVAPYLDALDRVLDLVEAVEARGIPLHHLDLGGGLGITYTDEAPPDAETFVRQLLRRIDERGHGHRTILFEPGRSLVGNAGVLLMDVLYLKTSDHPEGKHFAIVDAAMNDMMRPAMYEAWMRIEACQQRRDGEARTWDIVGPVCESGDWLGRDRDLNLRPGDTLALLSAGAYGMSMASHYNSRSKPAEVMIVDGQPRLVRERDPLSDISQRETGL